ncbi:MAG TPA: hypothetical protein VGP72_15745 [Planctomycetota bacterium]
MNLKRVRGATAELWAAVTGRLDAWRTDASGLADDDLTPPTARAIAAAYQLAIWLRDQTVPVPDKVVPDGNGGIVLEWSLPEYKTVSVDAEGQTELVCYAGDQIASRCSNASPAAG